MCFADSIEEFHKINDIDLNQLALFMLFSQFDVNFSLVVSSNLAPIFA